jgi:chemotaxis protein MotB
MMTMFVLFLSMYVYQTANQEFLLQKTPEIIGGDTTEALQSLDSSGATFPFAPIHPGLPLITGGIVKKIEQEKISPQDLDPIYADDLSPEKNEPEEKQEKPIFSNDSIEENLQTSAGDNEENLSLRATIAQDPAPSLGFEEAQPPATDQFHEIFTLSTVALKANNLDKFAAIDIIPDKTMRIILTGDLLFDLGESDLSEDASSSLQKIVEVVQHTPYMINIVGHTDNLPMRSNRFKSNWELSVARASTVARFLIDEMNMDPGQFVVSGYSSNRPIAPNTTAENRAKNRRVEIIISKRLPNPLPATAENLE